MIKKKYPIAFSLPSLAEESVLTNLGSIISGFRYVPALRIQIPQYLFWLDYAMIKPSKMNCTIFHPHLGGTQLHPGGGGRRWG